METKYEKRISELLKQLHKNRSNSQKEHNYSVASKSSKSFKNNVSSSQANFAHLNGNEVTHNEFEEDTDSTPADETNSNDRK